MTLSLNEKTSLFEFANKNFHIEALCDLVSFVITYNIYQIFMNKQHLVFSSLEI